MKTISEGRHFLVVGKSLTNLTLSVRLKREPKAVFLPTIMEEWGGRERGGGGRRRRGGGYRDPSRVRVVEVEGGYGGILFSSAGVV